MTNFDASYIAGDFSGIQSAIDASFNQIKTLCRNDAGVVQDPDPYENPDCTTSGYTKGYKSSVDLNFIEAANLRDLLSELIKRKKNGA